MPRTDHTRTERIEARCAPQVLATVRKAAALQGRSLSDFVVEAAHAAARHTLEEESVIRLAIEEQERFVELMLNPPQPSAALQKAKAAHAALFGTDK